MRCCISNQNANTLVRMLDRMETREGRGFNAVYGYIHCFPCLFSARCHRASIVRRRDYIEDMNQSLQDRPRRRAAVQKAGYSSAASDSLLPVLPSELVRAHGIDGFIRNQHGDEDSILRRPREEEAIGEVSWRNRVSIA